MSYRAAPLPQRVARFQNASPNVGHLESLVDKVLKESAYIQTDVGIKLECRTFDLWPLVESVIEDVNPLASTAGTKLINKIPEDLTVYADASLLRRIFQNLLANAITHARGKVVIGAREGETARLSAGSAITAREFPRIVSGTSSKSLRRIAEEGGTAGPRHRQSVHRSAGRKSRRLLSGGRGNSVPPGISLWLKRVLAPFLGNQNYRPCHESTTIKSPRRLSTSSPRLPSIWKLTSIPSCVLCSRSGFPD